MNTTTHTAPVSSRQVSRPVGIPAKGLTRAPKLSFGGVLRAEWIKLSSLRSVRIIVLLAVVGGIALNSLVSIAASFDYGTGGYFGSDAASLQGYLLMVSTFSAPFMALIFGALGVFAIGSEYSSGMILSTLIAVPSRTPVFVAKGIVAAALSFVMGLILTVVSLAVAVLAIPDAGAHLFTAPVLTGALGAVLFLTLITAFAYGVAALLRSTAGGIVVVLGIMFVLPIAMMIMVQFIHWDWLPTVMGYLPDQLGSTLTSGVQDVTENPEAFGYGKALACMIGWVAAVTIPAAITFNARDAR
ncbi:ABC transporter permease [Leucobacter sp. 1207-22]|uniref:ABC transporter permease n=1 Tax=Leucobacter sp. 1207-22 TaxID=2604456 RepID=UPI004063181F